MSGPFFHGWQRKTTAALLLIFATTLTSVSIFVSSCQSRQATKAIIDENEAQLTILRDRVERLEEEVKAKQKKEASRDPENSP